MNNQNYNFSTNSSSSSNTSSSTQQFPMFGTNYQPTTQPQPQSQSPSMWANCYRPIPVQSDFQFQEYQQQQNAWSQPQFFQQQQNPFPQPQQFPNPKPQHFSSQPPFCSQPIQPSTSHSSPKKTKKGKKPVEPSPRQFWDESEALSLAKCWVDISEDPAIGNNQDADGFWARVHEIFTNLHPNKPRTVQSVTGKWKDLRKKTKQFCGVMSGFESHRASGVSDADIMKAALQEYQSMYKKPFTHIDVYEFLKDKGKWKNPNPLGLGPKKRIADEDIHVDLGGDESGGEGDAFHADKDTTERPPGRPRPAKQQRSTSTGEGSSKSSLGELASSLNENFSFVSTKKVEAVAEARSLMSSKQKKIDIDILKTTHDGLSPKEIEWLENEKHAIRVRWGLL